MVGFSGRQPRAATVAGVEANWSMVNGYHWVDSGVRGPPFAIDYRHERKESMGQDPVQRSQESHVIVRRRAHLGYTVIASAHKN